MGFEKSIFTQSEQRKDTQRLLITIEMYFKSYKENTHLNLEICKTIKNLYSYN
jgi:hypothetical protein